ncbi:MAG: TetR/AcrR family transcriptional regulator [Kofleriaceae bacterium]
MADAVKDKVLAASLELVATGGVAALSMREVARRADVSHQAPYHYFADKEAIIAALVERGFDLLSANLATAAETKKKDDSAAFFARCARAYVDFALDNPAYFRVMFRPDLVDVERFPAAKAAGDRAFAFLEQFVAPLGKAMTPARRAALVSMVWAEVHGLATLLVDGKLAVIYPDPKERERHVHAVIQLFVERAIA